MERWVRIEDMVKINTGESRNFCGRDCRFAKKEALRDYCILFNSHLLSVSEQGSMQSVNIRCTKCVMNDKIGG